MITTKKTDRSNDIEKMLTETGLDGKGNWRETLLNIKPADVEQALAQPVGLYNLNKMTALVSPAAENYLEQMARLAHQLTLQRFGRTIQLYAPLYLSSYCINSCLYCGYNTASKCERTRLSIEEALEEAEVIASEGFRHILLVSSEDKEFITIDYLAKLAEKLSNKFSSISIEVYPMGREQYAKLYQAGIDGVTLYQETYDRRTYAHFHPAGPKADYSDRLAVHDLAGQAGMRRLGLGALLGLSDWRIETLALAEHAHYLMKRYWQSQVSISFPRLRPAHKVESAQFRHLLCDKELVQMMLALRLCFADVGLVLSTRESPELRDRLVGLGITRMSAGSKTSPGGYTGKAQAVKQFEIDDRRTPAEVATMIKSQGFEAVWKDWDTAFGPD
jgi:2-iminoacetate synthase